MCFMKNSQHTMNLIRVCMTIFQPRRARASRAGVGLGVMLVGKGGSAGESGRASPCSSGFLASGARPARAPVRKLSNVSTQWNACCLAIENYCLVSWRAIAMENY